MIKRILSFTLVFAFILSFVSCTGAEDHAAKTTAYEENPENIVTVPELSFEVVHSPLTDDDYFNSQFRNSQMVQENEWIYFYFGYKVYKAKANGENLTKLSDNEVRSMWVKDGELYLEGGWGAEDISKIKADGTKEVFFDDNETSISEVCVSSEGIYAVSSRQRRDAIYIYLSEYVYSIQLFDWNGTVVKKDDYAGNRNDDSDDFQEFILYNGDGYYLSWYKDAENTTHYSIGRYNFNGDREEIITDTNRISGLTEMNGKIFYHVSSDGDYILHCINPDGSECKQVIDEPIAYRFRADSGWIYYMLESEGALYRKNFETGIIEELLDFSKLPDGYTVNDYEVLGNWIYMKMRKTSDYSDLYVCRMKTDGLVFETILSESDFE